ncbi:hypothetical protein OSB04_028863 [Centaurea solstitialis]|uniref:Uncharacterized protein n=1 Tax=Centaurea solstitialis TaxID=347529 RepID=A0AA38W116_9ASTR|nr:hypothetical protein OSB04_028863 [Centaurea solstitialis]
MFNWKKNYKKERIVRQVKLLTIGQMQCTNLRTGFGFPSRSWDNHLSLALLEDITLERNRKIRKERQTESKICWIVCSGSSGLLTQTTGRAQWYTGHISCVEFEIVFGTRLWPSELSRG